MPRRQVVKAKGKLYLQKVSTKPDRQTKIREQTETEYRKRPQIARARCMLGGTNDTKRAKTQAEFQKNKNVRQVIVSTPFFPHKQRGFHQTL